MLTCSKQGRNRGREAGKENRQNPDDDQGTPVQRYLSAGDLEKGGGKKPGHTTARQDPQETASAGKEETE